MRTRRNGFSLIELLIVVAIILIIAAIAIPNLLRSKMAANEASSVGTLRTLNTAASEYLATYGGYPGNLPALGPIPVGGTASSTLADLVDSTVASGAKSGYSFVWTSGATDASGRFLTYSITAQPTNPGITGQRYFYTDQSGVIRGSVTGMATAISSPLS